jgi:hypothetical protein
MFDIGSLGRMLLIVGGSIAVIGLLLILGGRFLPWLGRLPGDIHIQRGNFSCFFPLVTSIVLSLILTIVLNIIIRLINK